MNRFLLGLVAAILLATSAAAQTQVLPGQYNASPRTLIDTQKGFLELDSSGRLVLGTSTANIGNIAVAGTTTPSDNFANPTTANLNFGLAAVWDGATWDRLPGNSVGGVYVQGNVADDAAAGTTQPVPVGGIANTTLPTYTAADRAQFQFTTGGGLVAALGGNVQAGADGLSNANIIYPYSTNSGGSLATQRTGLAISPQTFNGTTWDRTRSVLAGIDSTGVGIQAAGVIAQLDDTSPTAVTENQFAPVRLTAQRSLMVSTPVVTVSTTVTRPADTNAYAANDAFSNSTSAPTAGGYTLTSACAASGGNGTIKSAVVTASGATVYSGELWIFDQAVTNVNDNAAFTISDGEAQTLVGVIPFTTSDITAANSISYVNNINLGYTCVGSANLRFLVKIMSAVTPTSAEVLSVRVQVQN